MSITISHTHADGTIVYGDVRPHHGIVKALGFRWSRNIGDGGAWYVPRSRDTDAGPKVERAAAALREVGFAVVVEVDNTRRGAADREHDHRERASARAGGLDAKADRLAAASDARYEAAHAIADMIPLGQPVLVGHHSERRHRRDLARMESGFQASFELATEAQETARRADASRGRVAHRESAPATIRRIDRLETERRGIERRLGDARRGGHAAWEAQLLGRLATVDDDLAFWREHLAKLEADGLHVWGPDDFRAGDRVNESATVVRVNRRTLTVRHDVWGPDGHTSPLPYDKVRSVQDHVRVRERAVLPRPCSRAPPLLPRLRRRHVPSAARVDADELGRLRKDQHMASRANGAAVRPHRDGPLRVVAYLRVSTEEQAVGGVSLDWQRQVITDAARMRGWEVVRFVEDAGVSSAKRREKRPGFVEALGMLQSGEVDGIVAAKLDRLFRSVIDLAFLVEESRQEGWHVFLLDPDIDPTTTNGELVAGVLALVAQWERRVIGDRTRVALALKKAAGVQLGRRSGISADVLSRMRVERAAGWSFERIARGLNDDGVPTAQGGARWYHSTVRKVLGGDAPEGEELEA